MKKATTSFSDPELLKKATEITWAREKLQTALREAEGELPIAETKLQAARITLSDKEVQVALDISESSTQELAALNQALLEQERARARICGLQTRLADQEPELADMVEKLSQAHRDWSRDVWQGFMRDTYQPALAAFREAINHGRAVGLALGVNVTLPTDNDFQDLPAAEPSPAFSQPLEIIATLKRSIAECRARGEFTRRQTEFRSPIFDPSGKFRIMKDCMVNGVPFKTGDIIDARSVSFTNLERLFKIKSAVLISDKNYVLNG